MSINASSIVLIDDDEATNFIHKLTLKKAGINLPISSFINPLDGLEYISNYKSEKEAYSLIFLDINMPQLSGWDFIEKVATTNSFDINNYRIVMISSSVNPDDKKRGDKIPHVFSYLSKPLSVEVLHKLFKQLV